MEVLVTRCAYCLVTSGRILSRLSLVGSTLSQAESRLSQSGWVQAVSGQVQAVSNRVQALTGSRLCLTGSRLSLNQVQAVFGRVQAVSDLTSRGAVGFSTIDTQMTRKKKACSSWKALFAQIAVIDKSELGGLCSSTHSHRLYTLKVNTSILKNTPYALHTHYFV